MASNSGWDKTTPAGASNIASGDDNIRAFKTHMEAWWEDEHYGTDGSANSAGVHKSGSGKAFYQVTAPTAVLPQGQIWFDSANSYLKVAGAAGTGSWMTVNPATNSVISQAAGDAVALRFRNLGVSHGLNTAIDTTWEDNDYFSARIAFANQGGVTFRAAAEDVAQSTVINFQAYGGTADTTKTSAGLGLVNITAAEHDGANSLANITADGNVLSVRGYVGGGYSTLFLVDEDGDILYDGTSTAYDTFDDAELVRAFALATSDSKELVRSEFDDFVKYNEDDLVNLGILGAPRAEGGLVNLTQLQKVLVGAVWQLHTANKRLEEKLQGLQERLLPEGA